MSNNQYHGPEWAGWPYYVFNFGNKTPAAPVKPYAYKLSLVRKIRAKIVMRIWAWQKSRGLR